MITPTDFAEAYERNVEIVKLHTEGLSQADSLLQLPFRANCMNWVVGHIVTNRHSVLKLPSGAYPPEAEKTKRYERESQPVTCEGDGVLPLPKLIELLDLAGTQMAARLAEMTLAELERSVAFLGDQAMSVAEWLLFFYFHDSYHTGQTEILRQAAGKDDKII